MIMLQKINLKPITLATGVILAAIMMIAANASAADGYQYYLTGNPEHCVARLPLNYRNIAVYRIGPGGAFDIIKWQGDGGIDYTLGAENGSLVSSRESAY